MGGEQVAGEDVAVFLGMKGVLVRVLRGVGCEKGGRTEDDP